MYELCEKLATSLVSLLKAEMANSLGRHTIHLLETYLGFFWHYSETPY